MDIPGVSTVIARVIVAEVGLDMTRFPTHHHLISWAGLCPRLDESAGKSRSRHIRKGNPWLKVDLTQAAMAARRAKHSYLRAQFNRLATRRGVKKAVVAVAASILTSAYFILRDGVTYRDLGPDCLNRRDPGTSLVVSPSVSKLSALQSISIRRRKGFLIGEGFHPSQITTLRTKHGPRTKDQARTKNKARTKN